LKRGTNTISLLSVTVGLQVFIMDLGLIWHNDNIWFVINMFILWKNRTMDHTLIHGIPDLLGQLRWWARKVMKPSLRIYHHTNGHTKLDWMVGTTNSLVKTHLSDGNLGTYR